ncbi:Imm26 family immunity protein [Pseudomonas sp. R3-18-08]|uniref:Imm26 family immunity protein n=1 Tax=Pseudomonas sp. R3-18-08 TaxID=1173283 RepID=UPI000F571248|nr:Imm26 family immunity protein [Pseudomonas sp. R3-18-08]AZF18672.1 hypothetical protein C4J92_5235 [Pseudomonas sp. R3-18-08]
MKTLTAPKPGDLFYIPAVNASDEPGFVIARFIELIPPALGHLIEVFAKFHTQIPESINDIDTSKRLFRPIFCSMRFSGIPRWKILFSDPNYQKAISRYDEIQFAFDSEIWTGGVSKPASERQLANIEPSICWRMDHLIFRVIAHLRGALAENEPMDYERLPPDLRVDSTAASERVNKAVISAQALFKAH